MRMAYFLRRDQLVGSFIGAEISNAVGERGKLGGEGLIGQRVFLAIEAAERTRLANA